MGFSRCARGILVFASKARCGPIPLRLEYLVRSAGTVLRSLRRLWGGWGFRAVREGILVFASKARYGPIPLRLAYGALRGNGPALAEEAPGRMGFSRCARGILLFASKARCGPIPLRFAYLGRSAGTVLRSLRRLWGGWGFRAVREGIFGDRFQGLLRTDPAPPGVLWGT